MGAEKWSEAGRKWVGAAVKAVAAKWWALSASTVLAFLGALAASMNPHWEAWQWGIFAFLSLCLASACFFGGLVVRGRAWVEELKNALDEMEDTAFPYPDQKRPQVMCDGTVLKITRRPVCVRRFLHTGCGGQFNSEMATSEYAWRCDTCGARVQMGHHSANGQSGLQKAEDEWLRMDRSRAV